MSARAQQVFDDISRRRVDPGLLQTTTGNNYELRIYPLPAGATRAVELTIVEAASAQLRIPLGDADRVAAFDLSLRLPGAIAAPEPASASTPGLRFERMSGGGDAARSITHDTTCGYGPEEFALRFAKPGKYRIEANFFGHRQQVLTSGTGLMLWLSSGFGTPAQQDRRTTLRVKSERGERVVVGEFEVKPRGAAGG